MPVADSIPDQGVGDAAPIIPKGPVEPSGVLENLTAGYRAARAGPASTNEHQNNAESPYYDQIVNALNARGHRTSDLVAVTPGAWGYTGPKNVPTNENGIAMIPGAPRPFRNPLGLGPIVSHDNPLAWGQREVASIWAAVNEERKRNPSFLKDLPDQNALQAKAHADRQQTFAQSQDISDRAGWMGKVAGFVGGIAAAPFEPESYVGGPGVGAAGKTVAATILKHAVAEGGVNAISGALALPGMIADSHAMGTDMTAGDMVKQVGEQAAFGAVAGSARVVVPKLIAPVGKAAVRVAEQAVDHLPQPVKTAAMTASIRAGTIEDRAMVHEVRRGYAPFTVNSSATPDETAAIHTVERDADVREASPFHRAGDPQNDNRLSAVMASLGIEQKPPAVLSPAPLPAGHPASPVPAPAGGYVGAITKAEGLGGNPNSSSYGYGQFTKSTWLATYRKHFGGGGKSDEQVLALRTDKNVGSQMIQAYGSDNGDYLRRHGAEDSNGNRSLAHFLGPADAVKVLQADPGKAIESIIAPASFAANKKLLQGKSASELIAWAHKRVGEASGAPVARADSIPDVEPYDDAVDESLPPIEHRTFRPDELITDAAAMQYKSGGDETGVTDRLRGVEQWNPLLSGKAVVWERADGKFVVADGHQRLGLAQRLAAADPTQNINLDAVVLREADGVTAQQVRVAAALKNIAEGTGSAVDAARVLRDAPHGIRQLPPNAENVKTARGLADLSNDAFGAVLNNVIDPRAAAEIGRYAGNQPATHMALIKLLKDASITTPGPASTVVRQALADGFGQSTEHQLGMFEDVAPQQSLYGPAAKVLETAKRQLRDEKRSFKTLTQNETRIEAAGNKLDRAANQGKVTNSETAIAIIDATAHSSGPVRDALLAAARKHLAGDSRGAVAGFLHDLGGIDLHAAARGVSEGSGTGSLSEPLGHTLGAGEADTGVAEGRGVSGGPTAYDQAREVEQASLGFSDPVSADAEKQTAGVEHDLKMELDPNLAARQAQEVALKVEAPMRSTAEQDSTMGSPLFDSADQPSFRLSEDGDEMTFGDILKQADSDLSAIDAVRNCL
jgi:hypothetical protein